MSVPLAKLPPTNLQRGEPQVRGQWEEARQAFPNPFTPLISSTAELGGRLCRVGGGVGSTLRPAIPLSNMLIQALHLQIRKLRPKFTKVIVWAGMPWAGRVSVKALRRGGGERRENKESEKQTTENRTETGI